MPLLTLLLVGLLTAAEPLNIAPTFQRFDFAPNSSTTHALMVSAPPGTVITAMLADCACLSVSSRS